jgi:tetratricopeptide (TPR) repeat protein
VDDPIEAALQDARRYRQEGRSTEAEQAYRQATEQARSNGNLAALAHALRHMSDLARQRDAPAEARTYASEAVELYRKSDDRLGLANAIRLRALSAASAQEATAEWQEARDLYLNLGVLPGIEECDANLRR